MRLYRSWLGIFPSGAGQLLDRGFCGIAKWYPKRIHSFYPAVVKDREKGGVTLTNEQVIDSSEQAADRYTCEVVYRRVKTFDILHGHLPRKFLPYITTGWYVAHMFAQYYPPLRESVAWPMRHRYLRDAIRLAPCVEM